MTKEEREALKLQLQELLAEDEPDEEEAGPEEEPQWAKDLKAEIAELKKPAEIKVPDLDPQENGDPNWGYPKGDRGLGEYAVDVKRWSTGERPERLVRIKNATKAAGAGLQENVDSEGGFLIPTEQRSELLAQGLAKVELLNRVTNIPMQSNTVKIPIINESDRSGGTTHGGVRMYWKAEEAAGTKSAPSFGEVQLSLNKLFGLTYASSELLEDSPISIGPLLTQMFTESWAWQMDYEILNGSGAGRPEGILNAPALVSVAKETDQSAATIVIENIVKMYSRMPAQNRRNAVWIANSDAFPQLATMTLAVGTGGVAVYMPANGLSGKPYDSLLGKPLIFSEHCQKMGTTGDIYLADLSQYLIGTKAGAGIKQDTSIHIQFVTDESAFRFTYRVDGKAWWPSAITPRHSDDTLSPFVAIAVRA